MRRAPFVAGLSVALVPRLVAASTPIVVAVSAPRELSDEAESSLAAALIARGVRVIDPSAIEARLRVRARASARRIAGGAEVEWEAVAWIEQIIHARRALFVNIAGPDSVLPYGEFSVHRVRAHGSYRAFDTATRRMLAAGTAVGDERGEDADEVTRRAVEDAIGDIARNAASTLRS